MSKPRGSGGFALAFGIFFVILCVASIFFNLREISPYLIFQVWLAFAGAVLLIWGFNRLKNGDNTPGIGQPTINFVVGLFGVTIALFTLVATTPSANQECIENIEIESIKQSINKLENVSQTLRKPGLLTRQIGKADTVDEVVNKLKSLREKACKPS